MSLEEIKNNYAITRGFYNWRNLIDFCFETSGSYFLDADIRNVMKIYAMECLKLASENCHPFQQSITNENNIIK